MYIEEITKEQYDKLRDSTAYIYSDVKFNMLNEFKIDMISYLLFKDTKLRFLLCVGIKDDMMFCPFSAPFGTFIKIKDRTSIKQYDEALEVLDEFIASKNYKACKFILPPDIYYQEEIILLINSLFRANYTIKHIDINFQFDFKEIILEKYIDNLSTNARRNLKIALSMNLKFIKCEMDSERAIAYNIIKNNREYKGYPLRMSYEQILETSKIVKSEFFMVKYGENYIASAIVFYVKMDIAQLIYWGDINGYSEYKPMNFLAYHLISYYKKKGISYLDIGPASDEGIPNYGLCDFKKSIGCETSNKFTFEKKYCG